MSSVIRLPYPGLRAFRRDETDVFFGRETCIDDMVDKLALTRFLSVLGSSGSGKSSIVRTGLLNALEMGINRSLGADWMIIDMHPGNGPFNALAAGLLGRQAATDASDDEIAVLADHLRQSPQALGEWCDINLPPQRRLLILVDQFEELFRYSGDSQREEIESFVHLLIDSAAAIQPIYIVLTMRSEYLGACSLISGLAEHINAGMYLTPRMTREQCRAAIEGPARVCGFAIEPALVARLLNDMSAFAPFDEDRGEKAEEATAQLDRISRRADQLPLMQHVLNRLWQKATNASPASTVTLRLAVYDDLGGLEGALDEHGKEILQRLGADAWPAVEKVFRALVSGTGVLAVRRPCPAGELLAVLEGDRILWPVLEAFRAADCNFLMPPQPVRLDANTLIDISHESLIRQWSQLTQWAAAEDAARLQWAKLAEAARAFADKRGELLTGLDLAACLEWWDREHPTAAWASRYRNNYKLAADFLDTSKAERNRLAQASAAAAEAQKKRDIRDGQRRLRNAFLAAFTVLVSAGAFFGVAQNNKLIEKEREISKNRLNSSEIATLSAKENQRILQNEKYKLQISNSELEKSENLLFSTKVKSTKSFIVLSEVFFEQFEETDQRRLEICSLLSDHKSDDDDLNGLCGIAIDRTAQISASRTSAAADADTSKQQAALANGAKTTQSGGTDVSGELLGRIPGKQLNVAFDDAEINVLKELEESTKNNDNIRRAQKYHDDTAQKLDAGNAHLRSPRGRNDMSALADYANTAYSYVFFLDDNGLKDQARRYLDQFNTIIAQYTAAEIQKSPVIAMAAVQSYRLTAIVRSDDTKLAEDSEKKAWSLAQSLRKAGDKDAEFLRMYVNMRLGEGEETPTDKGRIAQIAEICNIADELDPTRLTAKVLLARCQLEKYDNYQLFPQEGDRITFLNRAQSVFSASEHKSTVKLARGHEQDFILAKAYATLAEVYNDKYNYYTSVKPDTVQSTRWAQRAFRVFSSYLNDPDTSYPDSSILSFLPFDGISDWKVDADDNDPEDVRRAHILTTFYFADLAKTAGTLAQAYEKNDKINMLAGRARAKVVELMLANTKKGDTLAATTLRTYNDDARANFIRSVRTDLLRLTDSQYGDYSDQYVEYCNSRVQSLDINIQMGNTTAALSRMDEIDKTCGAVFNRFQWDFYLWSKVETAHWKIGKYLYDNKIYDKAKPNLDYASNWGTKEATQLLQTMYDKGLGVRADAGRAQDLGELAKMQSMKRFTVPATFGGVIYPFNMYIIQFPREFAKRYPGVTGQRDWLKYTRGGAVPQDVIDAFNKLQQIAFDNDVSYPDLCVYALSAAQKDKNKADSTSASSSASSD